MIDVQWLKVPATSLNRATCMSCLLPYRRATLEECLDVARKLKPAERCDTPIPMTPWKTKFERVSLRIDPSLEQRCLDRYPRPVMF
jgi:hypothetical protein